MKPFVHLHNHTEFSLLDGAARIVKMVERAAEYEMPALAITDHGAMYGVVQFYRACEEAGIKPIIGVEAYVSPRRMTQKDPRLDQKPFHMLLLAKDFTGYQNLINITTAAHLEGYYYKPRIDREFLASHCEGLIGTTSCLAGEAARKLQQGDLRGAEEVIATYREMFGEDSFFLEVQDHPLLEDQKIHNEHMVQFAERMKLPLLATNDAHYVDKEDADGHEILLCIQTNKTLDDPKRMRAHQGDFSLRPPADMWAAFEHCAEAAENTLRVAEMCDLKLEFGNVHLPDFPVPPGHTPDTYLRELCRQGLQEKLGGLTEEVQKRLEYELGVIGGMGYARYFLIVYDIIKFARDNGILTSCRGSAAGSIVTFALGITPINPLVYNIPFERFLNTARYTMPDIDIDFMDTRRDEVIDYITRKYGEDHTAQIITFGTMMARAAVRDVGRVLGVPLAEVDRIAKMIPPMTSLEKALHETPDLQTEIARSERSERLLRMARQVEGLSRHASTHAAGVVISRDPLTQLVPLQAPTKGTGRMTQYAMNDLSELGLLKFDILGLTNLSILAEALELIEKRHGVRVELESLPLDDRKTYELLGTGETTGVFQLESPGMRKHLKELKPTEIFDLMAMVALYRPGPMNNIPAYIRRKRGEEPIRCLHPLMEEPLSKTYGVMVYQEDVMAVARAMADYDAREADVFCYAIRKKKAKQLAEQRERFANGCRAKGIADDVIDKVFELFEPFARYGFCKGHAACYGLVAYQTAYLKANYPSEYMAAVLSAAMGDQDRMALCVSECQRLGLHILPPDINESDAKFMPTAQENCVRFGLGAIKSLGEAAVGCILADRELNGLYKHPADFISRMDTRKISREQLEALIKSGAFDSFNLKRSQLMLCLPQLQAIAASQRHNREVGQVNLFGDEPEEALLLELPDVPEYENMELANFERDLLGVTLREDPLLQLLDALEGRYTARCAELSRREDNEKVSVAGIVGECRPFSSANGPMMFVTLTDRSGSCECVVFAKALERFGELLRQGAVVIVRGCVGHRGKKRRDGEEVVDTKLRIDHVEPASPNSHVFAEPEMVHIRVGKGNDAKFERLKSIFGLFAGSTPVTLHLEDGNGGKKLKLGPSFRVNPLLPGFKQQVEALLGQGAVVTE